jgi:uncharacterized protein
MNNPFEFGRELSPEELVDRQQEVLEVRNTIRQAGKLFLIGPRRYGKTSILRAAADSAKQHDRAVVLRYDAQAFPTLDQLATRLVADTARALTPTFEKAGALLKTFFSHLRPTLSYDTGGNSFSVSIQAADDRLKGAPLLADVFDAVDRAAVKADAPVAVIIDEFQKIVEDGGSIAEGQIRAAIQRHEHVGYVFAGSKTRLLTDMVGEESRPFYKLGQVRFLGPVPRAEFAAFLAERFKAGDIGTTGATMDTLLDCVEEVPYNVQALAHACWERCRAAGDPPTALTPDLVVETRDTLALRSDPIYTTLWSALSSAQQRSLLALLREGAKGLSSTDLSRRYGVLVPTIQKSLRALAEKDILREEQTLGTTRLRLEDPFFGAWINLVIPH